MDIRERDMPWVQRVEALIEALDGSTVGELELREGGIEIIIRRRPDLVLTSAPMAQATVAAPSGGGGARPQANAREDRSLPVTAPLTGVYYSAPSPNQPPFVNIGDVVHVGQVIALVEAMKVFNEIQSEVAGRVVGLVAKNGEVVQKGSALFKVEPV